MNRKTSIYLIIGLVLISAVVLIIVFRSGQDLNKSEGTMSATCPVKVYQIGETFSSPCQLRPMEECTWFDSNNCEFIIKNIDESAIHKGQRTEVFKSTVKGMVQFLEIHIIEIQ